MFSLPRLIALLGLVLLVSGCSPGPEPVPMTPSPTSETITDEVYSDTLNDDEILDEIFIKVLKAEKFSYSTPTKIIAIAHMICDALDVGVSKMDVVDIAMDNDYGPYDAGYLVGAATGTYCTEHVG